MERGGASVERGGARAESLLLLTKRGVSGGGDRKITESWGSKELRHFPWNVLQGLKEVKKLEFFFQCGCIIKLYVIVSIFLLQNRHKYFRYYLWSLLSFYEDHVKKIFVCLLQKKNANSCMYLMETQWILFNRPALLGALKLISLARLTATSCCIFYAFFGGSWRS